MASAPPTTLPLPMKPGSAAPLPPTDDPVACEAGEDLLYAARAGDGEELGAALAAGAPVNFSDETGRTGEEMKGGG